MPDVNVAQSVSERPVAGINAQTETIIVQAIHSFRATRGEIPWFSSGELGPLELSESAEEGCLTARNPSSARCGSLQCPAVARGADAIARGYTSRGSDSIARNRATSFTRGTLLNIT